MMIAFIIVATLLLALVTDIYVYGLQERWRDRKYKSGTGWCVWRWTDVEREYILRLHVIKTPWFAVCLHWINKPDKEPWLHDHPVSFLSLVLRGGYAELRQKPGEFKPSVVWHGWRNFLRSRGNDKHRITYARKGTLTLALMGPKTREWGFHTPDGWIMWKDYYARLKAGEDMRCENVDYAITYLGERDATVVWEEVHGAAAAVVNGWYWYDETWYPNGPYGSAREAQDAQAEYVVEVLGL